MLHEFLTLNRNELIERCRVKVAKRFEPSEIPSAIDHGVPLFLQQLIETLRFEQTTLTREVDEPAPAPAPTEIGRAAALHGAELLRLGFSVDQVVHDYGDVCQSVTEMAVEQNAPISADEFRTLNRCLDNAIADAVASFGRANQNLIDDQALTLQKRVESFSAEHLRLVDIATHALTAIRTGKVGIAGQTGALLAYSLTELRSLAARILPEIRLPSSMNPPEAT
jgi:hypothetical protein